MDVVSMSSTEGITTEGTTNTPEAILCAVWQLENPVKICSLLRSLSNGNIRSEAQAALLACLQHPITQGFPAGHAYQSRLLKAVVLAIEEDGQEVDDRLADMHMALLLGAGEEAPGGLRCPMQIQWSYKTYVYGGKDDSVSRIVTRPSQSQTCSGLITLRFSLNLFEGGTGCHVWEAGFLLAEFIMSFQGLFKGKKCLELGCGSGVVGVALFRAGAARILLTDGNSDAVQNCEHNMRLNDCKATDETNSTFDFEPQDIQIQEMNWENFSSMAADVILAADVLYDPGAIPALVQVIRDSLFSDKTASEKAPSNTCTAYIATTKRNIATLQKFLNAVSEAQLHVQDLTSKAFSCPVRFYHHLALQPQRANIVLHQITCHM